MVRPCYGGRRSSALRSRIPAGCSTKHQPARRAAHAQSEGRLNLSRPQGEPPPGATAATGGLARPGPAGSTRTCALQPRRVRWSLHRHAPAKRRWPLPDRVAVHARTRGCGEAASLGEGARCREACSRGCCGAARGPAVPGRRRLPSRPRRPDLGPSALVGAGSSSRTGAQTVIHSSAWSRPLTGAQTRGGRRHSLASSARRAQTATRARRRPDRRPRGPVSRLPERRQARPDRDHSGCYCCCCYYYYYCCCCHYSYSYYYYYYGCGGGDDHD